MSRVGGQTERWKREYSEAGVWLCSELTTDWLGEDIDSWHWVVTPFRFVPFTLKFGPRPSFGLLNSHGR